MELLAIAALGFFAVGYFILGGADIGLGMLLPALGRSPHERRVVIAAIAPFFLGNEVWLVATAGVLIGTFPALEGDLLTGLFPAVVLLLFGWVLRDAGLWFRGRGAGTVWTTVCDVAVTGGSWTVALSWGWMLSGLLAGMTDTVATGLGAALAALAIASIFALHGLAFASLRLSGALRRRARAMSGRSGEGWTFALTSTAMTVLCLAVGFRLPLADSAADPATLALLVPTLLTVAPLLVAVQAWVGESSGIAWKDRRTCDDPAVQEPIRGRFGLPQPKQLLGGACSGRGGLSPRCRGFAMDTGTRPLRASSATFIVDQGIPGPFGISCASHNRWGCL